MKILFINSVCGIGSTGQICANLAIDYEKQGHEVRIAFGRDGYVPEKYKKYAIRIGNNFDVRMHALYSRMFDAHGLGSKRATKEFLKWAEKYNPDLLWIHNIHGYYINFQVLFSWIKSHPKLEVRWTLHDCWAFTGHCTHFQVANCKQWKEQCKKCTQFREYPKSIIFDNCRKNFNRKRVAFNGVNNLTLITPSNWLAQLVKQSFLCNYPIRVEYNAVNTAVFKATPSDFRSKYNLVGKIIILGVSSVWNEKKGLFDFVRLSSMLDDRFKIVLVGLNPKQQKSLPTSILALPRTNNLEQLAEIYTAADYFVNPSREETFGMTSYEASLCGTPVIVYRGTACEEIAYKYNGYVVDQNVDSIYELIMNTIAQTCPE